MTGALEQIHVNSTHNVNNVTVGVHPFGNFTITWSLEHHDIERIVMATGNASKVIGKFQNGEFHCYKGGFLMETKCQEHFSLNVNASGDVIIAMRNIAHPYFGSYLVSIYRGPDDNIDTLWITVYKKAGTAAPMSTVTLSTGVTSQVNETTNNPRATVTTTPGPSNKNEVVILATIVAVAVLIPLGGIVLCYWCCCNAHRRRRDDEENVVGILGLLVCE